MSADTIDISLLVTRHNVRTDVDGDLVDAVKEHGVLEPLSIYLDDDKYVVHNGSRRLKAALIVGLTKVPYVLIDKPADDGTDIVRQVIVNTTQKALSYMDKAYAMRHLRDVCGWTQAAIADAFKLSAPDVSLAIRTTELPERLQDAVNSGRMFPSAIEPLLSLSADEQEDLADVAIKERTVSRVTAVVKAHKERKMAAKRVVGEVQPEEAAAGPDEIQAVAALQGAAMALKLADVNKIKNKSLRREGIEHLHTVMRTAEALSAALGA